MIYETFCIRLKELRTSRNLTLKQLGAEIGITESAVGSLEHGRRPVSLDTLVRIADYFNVSLDYLVGRSDKMERQ